MTSQRTRDRLIDRLRGKGIQDARVLNVLRNTPRHLFVDEALATRAYEDTALPIGQGQTISQPYIVARMTEALLADGPLQKILEIGAGSGYQTAILAQLVDNVYSLERIQYFIPRIRQRLKTLGITNVNLKHADGYLGWSRYASYDGILAAAAPDKVPQTLLEQLNPKGGRLVIPRGKTGHQELLLVTRQQQEFETRVLDMVSFVPLIEGVES